MTGSIYIHTWHLADKKSSVFLPFLSFQVDARLGQTDAILGILHRAFKLVVDIYLHR